MTYAMPSKERRRKYKEQVYVCVLQLAAHACSEAALLRKTNNLSALPGLPHFLPSLEASRTVVGAYLPAGLAQKKSNEHEHQKLLRLGKGEFMRNLNNHSNDHI
jgi:hypothetical protein